MSKLPESKCFVSPLPLSPGGQKRPDWKINGSKPQNATQESWTNITTEAEKLPTLQLYVEREPDHRKALCRQYDDTTARNQ